MIEFVMFDADGVLFESVQSNIAFYNAIFAQVGQPCLEPHEQSQCIFMATREVFAQRAGADLHLRERMAAVAAELDAAPFFRLLQPPFELRPFLHRLRQRYKLGLATNRSTTVPALIEHLDLRDIFDAITCLQDAVAPKPAPDLLNLCMKRAGVGAAHAIYVGDSPIDSEAAAAAGVGFIGVGQRVSTPHRIEALAELPALLERLDARV
ncbi:MAG TPA: HAD family hydrolase [Candidatus Binataceae bacterium]|nr:HAD family hydrolase [Candidatus Binataceae bacterium]